MLRSDKTKFGTVTRTIHWLTAIFVLIAFLYSPGGPESRVYSHARTFERQLHETLGMAVFALVILRVLWRVVDRRPEPPAVPPWMTLAARAVQWALYGLMFALPVTAIGGAWLEGHSVTLLGGIDIAPWVGEQHRIGATMAKIHKLVGDGILWLAGLHAAAALFHHIVLEDDVLVSMVPAWLLRRSPR